MGIRSILRYLLVTVLMAMALLGPVLAVTIPSSPVSAQTTLNTVEQAADNSIALGSLFKNCSVISADTGYLNNSNSLVGCLREVLSVVFIVAILWVIISLSSSMLGVAVRSGEGVSGGPIAKTRKKLENALIGLFLTGAPFLLLSLFSSNYTNTSLLSQGANTTMIQKCFLLRKKWENNEPQTSIARFYEDEIFTPFIKNKQRSTKQIDVLSGPIGEYALNLRYVGSDFCVGKLPLDQYRGEIEKRSDSIVKQPGIILASKNKNKLATVDTTPVKKTPEELQASVEDAYNTCRDDVSIAFFCSLVKTSAEVAGYEPSTTIPGEVEQRNRWVILTGRLYQIGFKDQVLGNAIADSLILSLERGSLDTESVKNSINITSELIKNSVYKDNLTEDVLDNHLQRVAYASQAISSLLQNNSVNSETAAYAVGFASTFISSTPPVGDSERNFVALKAAVVGNTMDLLINSSYSESAIVTTGFKTLTGSLRAYDKQVEAEVVSVVGQEAHAFMSKLENQTAGSYQISDSDYYQAALDIGVYAVSSAIAANQDIDPNNHLSEIVRISGGFGKNVINGEISCSQDLFTASQLVESAQLYSGVIESPSNTQENIDNAKRLYNQTIDSIRNFYQSLSPKPVTIGGDDLNNDELLAFLNNTDEVRRALPTCAGVQSSQVFDLTQQLIKAALPSSTPAIAGPALDFVRSAVEIYTLEGVDASLKQDKISLAIVSLAESGLNYVSVGGDTTTQTAVAIGQGVIKIIGPYLDISAQCKTALVTLRDSGITTITNTPWQEVYERYDRGVSSNEDKQLFAANDTTRPCLGQNQSELMSSLMTTAQGVYAVASSGSYDERIAHLIDPNRSDSISSLIISTIKDAEGADHYPQYVVIHAVDSGLYVIKNFNLSTDPLLLNALDSFQGATISLLNTSVEREKQCSSDTQSGITNPASCRGITEFDLTSKLLSSVKEVVSIQGPGDEFFDTMISVVQGYVGDLESGQVFEDADVAGGVLAIANSGIQALITSFQDNPELTEVDKNNLALGQNIAGKSFRIAKNYLTGREDCDASIADVEFRIRSNNTVQNTALLNRVYTTPSISPNDTENIVINKLISSNLGDNDLGNSTFRFDGQQSSSLEKGLVSCQDTASLDTARAVVDTVVEFVDIPGFPMSDAADLANYLIDTAGGIEQYSEYKSSQYIMRLLGAVITQEACNAKEGEQIALAQQQSREEGCGIVSSVFNFVDSSLQLYVDGTATDPNFARELLYLGKNLAMTFGADRFSTNQISNMAQKLVTLWEMEVNGETGIFNLGTVSAEFMNFVGAFLPHVLKTDQYTTDLIQVWSQVASSALTAPEAIDVTAAARATSAFVASKIWQCDTPNGRASQSGECAENVAADVTVFMGVLAAVNVGPVSEESQRDLCSDAGGNDICAQKRIEQIQRLQQGIQSGNENAFRQANSYLYTQSYDKRVRSADLNNASFQFTTGGDSQYEILRSKVSVCDTVGVSDEQTQPQNSEEAVKNDASVDYFDGYDFSVVSTNPCMRNPMIMLTSSLSLNLDGLVDTILYGLSSPYGLIGIGENQIVVTLAHVVAEMDMNAVASGDSSSIGRTLTKNIGYVIKSLPVEQLVGSSSAQLLGIVGDLPWETMIYNPLALGGDECLPPQRQLTRQVVRDPGIINSSNIKHYYDFALEPTHTNYRQAHKASEQQVALDVGVEKPNNPTKTPACTAALVTGVLARIDFSIVFSILGGTQAAAAGQFTNQIILILDRMDFSCPLGATLKDGTCDQSFGTVAKNIITILGVLDFALITDTKTGQFVREFVSTFPADVFSTGFSLAQMDRWVNLTGIVAEYLGVNQQMVSNFKQAYNDISRILREAAGIIQTIAEVIEGIDQVLSSLNQLRVAGVEIIDVATQEQIQSLVRDSRNLLIEIRKITDSFEQLKEVQIGYNIQKTLNISNLYKDQYLYS